MTQEKCRRMLPRVGSRMMLAPSGQLRDENKQSAPAPCRVLQVMPERLMFLVRFDKTGLREAFTVKDLLILSAQKETAAARK